MHNTPVDNRALWIGIGCFTLSLALWFTQDQYLLFASQLIGFFGFGLFIRDFITLKKKGLERPGWYWLLFLPGYVWKRNKLVGDNKPLLASISGILVIGIICTALVFVGVGSAMITDTAQSLVTEIVQRQGYELECLQVELGDEIAPNLYRATAVMSNTVELPISVRVTGDNMVYVEVLE